jgi:predicted dehydrogenase
MVSVKSLSTSSSYSRKMFLKKLGAGILSVSSFEHLKSENKLDEPTFSNSSSDPIPRSPLNAPTEVSESKFYPAPESPVRRMGFAIVGLGHLALSEVMPAFSACKYSKPVALVSGDSKKANIVADQYGIDPKNIYNYENFDLIADNKAIEAVYIILPNGMHHEFTIRAAKAGKHVLCEKPMANSVEECEEMIAACKKANRKLMIAYRIQYEPYNSIIKEWVRSKQYGNAKILEFFNGQNIGDPSQWRLKKKMAGGGSLVDVGIYCLNTCRFLLGEEPEAVTASVYTSQGDDRFSEVEETVFFQLHFPSGSRASCTTTYGTHLCRRYRIFTDKGAWYGLDPAFSYKGLQAEISQAKEKMEWKQHPWIPEKNQFALEIDHLSQCVAKNKKPYTPGEEGLQDQKIMDAIYKSAHDNTLVKLDKYTTLDTFRGDKPTEDE